jgi:hypothetical protein
MPTTVPPGPVPPDPSASAAAARAAQLLAAAQDLIAEASSLLGPLPSEPTDESIPHLLDAVETAETIRSAAAAAQMQAGVAVRAARIAQHRAAGRPRKDHGKGVAEELALSRRMSPARARSQLTLERVVVESMPRTLALLAGGEISPWAADEVAKAAIVLTDEDRARVDEHIAARLPEVSPVRAGSIARARADELDQAAALARHERAASARHVSIRPVSDALVRVSASLPTAQGVAVYAALDRAAASARSRGEAGSRGNHMADALFSRVTGLSAPEDSPVEIQLLMTDRTLLAGAADTAEIDGHPVPGTIARRLALAVSRPAKDGTPTEDSATTTDDPRRTLRRLYTDAISEPLQKADARRRRFTGPERRFIEMADRTCRTPWCDAPIRHIDHVQRHADGGATEIANGAGLCEQCNHTRELPGWSSRFLDTEPGTDHLPPRTLEVTTPSGRRIISRPPPLRTTSGPRTTSDPPPWQYPTPPAPTDHAEAMSLREIVAREGALEFEPYEWELHPPGREPVGVGPASP